MLVPTSYNRTVLAAVDALVFLASSFSAFSACVMFCPQGAVLKAFRVVIETKFALGRCFFFIICFYNALTTF